MSVREGGCSCGEIRYRLTADPLIVHCCHCRNCQRQTRSAFVINALIEKDFLELLAGEPQRTDVPRDDGAHPPRDDGQAIQPIYRCPTCQIALFSEYGRRWMWFVRTGTLDDPSAVIPDVHIYTRSKLDWITLPECAPAFDVLYDPQTVWPAASLKRAAAARGD